jgi:FlaA1/EpsC-like NDP-sugar epimerase
MLFKTPARNFVERILRLPHLNLVKPVLDLVLISLAAIWAWGVSFGQVVNPGSPLPFLAAVVCVRMTLYLVLQLNRGSWLHISRYEVVWLAISALLGMPVIGLTLWALPDPFTLGLLTRPVLLLTTEAAFYLLLLFGVRMTARAVAYSDNATQSRRILVLGAGQAGRALAFQIQESRGNYSLVGFLDDDAQKQRRRYRGVPVLGKTSDLVDVVMQHEVQEIVVAISAFDPAALRGVIAAAEQCKTPVRILPPLSDLIGSKPDFRALREIRMEDLLPRPEVRLDYSSIAAYLGGQTVLVTGGGGSIGSELCRQALAAGAARLLVLGRGENSVFETVQELNELNTSRHGKCEIFPVICDVRDHVGLKKIFERYSPQVVFHAAAHKHVPLMERYPSEAVKNNILGTQCLVALAAQFKVARFVMVSTDKAVDPTSVMGATKRLGEMLVSAYATYHKCNMVCVRFGNVLGSRGSVVPTMKRQIERGLPITVTDPEMVRYFMTIPEASQLILQAGAVGGCGEVFILDMGQPVRILDLAHDLIRLSGLVPDQDVPIHIVGRRPGEKMWEDLLTTAELKSAQKGESFYVAPTQKIDLAHLQGQISELIDIAQQGNDERVVAKIREVVPEFQAKSDVPYSPEAVLTPDPVLAQETRTVNATPLTNPVKSLHGTPALPNTKNGISAIKG